MLVIVCVDPAMQTNGHTNAILFAPRLKLPILMEYVQKKDLLTMLYSRICRPTEEYPVTFRQIDGLLYMNIEVHTSIIHGSNGMLFGQLVISLWSFGSGPMGWITGLL